MGAAGVDTTLVAVPGTCSAVTSGVGVVATGDMIVKR